jgi:sugar fermentation stimulation protein A
MYGNALVDAQFIVRENRFAALVEVDGRRETVHVPNTGRMKELLFPGSDVHLLPAASPGRKTAYDLVAVEMPGVRVSVDSRVPNAVVAEALGSRGLEAFSDYDQVHPERAWGTSRFDFHLQGPEGEAMVEVKGCTLVEEDGLALFPDAPTQRGTRHVRELAHAVRKGMAAYVVVVVQRSDGRVFAPNDRTDPAFGDALRQASKEGVEVLAYLTDVTRQGVDLERPIPVDLEGAMEVVT